jgi:hypothetical protein
VLACSCWLLNILGVIRITFKNTTIMHVPIPHVTLKTLHVTT